MSTLKWGILAWGIYLAFSGWSELERGGDGKYPGLTRWLQSCASVSELVAKRGCRSEFSYPEWPGRDPCVYLVPPKYSFLNIETNSLEQ